MKIWVLLSSFILLAADRAHGIKCYSCGGLDEPHCKDFKREPSFEQDCPEATSCMTADHGYGEVTQRSCWSQESNECNVAPEGENTICICTEDLCNCVDEPRGEKTEETCPTPKAEELRKNGAEEARPWTVIITFIPGFIVALNLGEYSFLH